MAQYDDSGVLFKNKDKTVQNPKWADYNGKATVGGVNYYLSAWIKTDKNGDKFMSIAFKLAEQKGQQRPQQRPQQRRDDDSIPF